MGRSKPSSKPLGKVSTKARVSDLDSRAEELFIRGKYSEARRLYASALRLETSPNSQAYFAGRIGICHFNTGKDREAFKFLLSSVRLFQPGKPEFMEDMYGFVHFHLGSLYEYYGKVAESLEARKVCERYIETQEKDTRWMLYAGMGRNYEALGRHDKAIECSQRAIQVLSDDDPRLGYLYESMANSYMGLRQYNEAVKHFSHVLQLDPAFERLDEIHLKMAESYRQLTNYRMALEIYQKLMELKQIAGKRENLIWLYARIAECHFRLEEFEKSLLVALEALRRQPRNKQEKAEIKSYLTINYYELRRYREAVKEGEKTLKLAKRFNNDDLFYVRMALSYYKLGDKKSFTKYRTFYKKTFREDGWNKYLEKLASSP